MKGPAQGFYFALGFDDTSSTSGVDAGFQEVTGLGISRDTMPINEGGENHLNFIVPSKAKYTPLELKRGFMTSGSELASWCMESLQSSLNKPIRTKNLKLSLFSPVNRKVISHWMFYNAYPVEWNLSGFNAMTSDFVIESIKIAFTYFGLNNDNTKGIARGGGVLERRREAIRRDRQKEKNNFTKDLESTLSGNKNNEKRQKLEKEISALKGTLGDYADTTKPFPEGLTEDQKNIIKDARDKLKMKEAELKRLNEQS